MAKKTTKAAPEVKITDETVGAPDEVTEDVPPVVGNISESQASAYQNGLPTSQDETTPPVVDETVTAEVPPAVDEVVVDKQDEPTPPKEESAVLPHHKAFFGQYIALMQERKTENSIKALNNCIKTVLASKSEQQYIDLVDMFREAKDVLSHKTVLQSAATIPSADRARLEVMIVILTTLANRTKIAISLDTARNVIKDNAFVDFVAKRMSTM